MATRLTKIVAAEVVGVTRGLWCPTCALPSGTVVVFLLTMPDGSWRMSQVAKCTDCRALLPAATT